MLERISSWDFSFFLLATLLLHSLVTAQLAKPSSWQTLSASVSVSAAQASTSTMLVPEDKILLSCGASKNDSDGTRPWATDKGSRYSPSLTTDGLSAATQDSSVPAHVPPYLTARLFTSPFTYSFPLNRGRKFLRLHFYSTDYSSHSATDGIFSVTAGTTTLLHNFSAFQLTQHALGYSNYLVLEFSLNIMTSGTLNLTFSPSDHSKLSYALINGIELISIPDLFPISNSFNLDGGYPRLVSGGSTGSYPFDHPDWAFQTAYRLNVGGTTIPPAEDSDHLFRSWLDDSPYIDGAGLFSQTFSADSNIISIHYSASLPEYIAPENVYSTVRSMGVDPNINIQSNLSWILPVDAGFYYLLRLHFCEIMYHEFTLVNQRPFIIYINNQIAQEGIDVIHMSHGIGNPMFLDFITMMPGTGPTHLRVELHPDTTTKPKYYDAILNGLEVLKMQDSNGNLAGPNPHPPPTPVPDPAVKVFPYKNKQINSHGEQKVVMKNKQINSHGEQKVVMKNKQINSHGEHRVVMIICVAVSGAAVMVVLLFFLFRKPFNKESTTTTTTGSTPFFFLS